jgi:subtilisin-like proprotein convertase family protein
LASLLAFGAAPSFGLDAAPTPLPAAPGHEAEPNDSAATASPIASGERIRASLFPAGDVDFYSFSASAGERVFTAVSTAGSAAGSSSNSQLTLLGSDETTVIEFDDENGSQSPQSSSIAGATIPSDGTYFLKVNDATPGTAPELPYDLYLQLRSGPPTAETEPNDTPATANPLGERFVSGARDPAVGTEQDWYSMPLQAGDTVFLSLDLDPERDGTSFDGRVGLGLTGDADKQVLVVNDPGADETPNPTFPSEAMSMTVGRSGTYYAYVDAASAAVGGPTATYDLSATVLPASQPSCRTYSSELSGPIFDGGSVSIPIPVADAMRIARAAVHLELTHPLMADLDASLETPEGEEIALFTDIGATATGGQARMNMTFDDFAAVPPLFPVVRPLMSQTEPASRLDWLDGMQAKGGWHLVLRDDNANGQTGALENVELILCPQPEETVEKEVFAADFEKGDEGFIDSGTADEWERGLPSTAATTSGEPVAGLSGCAHGTGCFKTDLNGTYNADSSQDLVSPAISLAGLSGPLTVSWEQWYQMEAARFDHASVQIEEVGGANARSLFTWQGPTMTSAVGNPVSNQPAAAGWGLHRADISEYDGKSVRLRFHLDSNGTGNYAGLAIDDVRIFQPGTPPEGSTPPPVVGPGSVPALNPVPPIGPSLIANLTISPKRFRAAAGATITYTDSRAATTTMTVRRGSPGRWASGRCQAPGRVKAGTKCTRFGPGLGGFTHVDAAGANRIHFHGGVDGKKLSPGKYRLEAVPEGSSGDPATIPSTLFRIMP